MAYDLDYEADHYCPAYKKVICADLCYDSMMCLNRFLRCHLQKNWKKLRISKKHGKYVPSALIARDNTTSQQ